MNDQWPFDDTPADEAVQDLLRQTRATPRRLLRPGWPRRVFAPICHGLLGAGLLSLLQGDGQQAFVFAACAALLWWCVTVRRVLR